jgi:hypothetical protein
MRLRSLPLLPALAVLLSGCAEELGPIPRRTARVSGRVHLGTTPIGSGFVEFYPVGGTVGNLRSAPLASDGTFEAHGVAVGTNLVRIVNPPFPLPVLFSSPQGRIGFEEFTSPIRRDVRDGASLEIDLQDERIRFLRNVAG